MGNIVWLASYPKSGNTWLRAFIYNLIENPDRPSRLELLTGYFESESRPQWYEAYLTQSLSRASFEEVVQLRPQVHRDIASKVARGSIMTKTHNQFTHYNGVPLHNMDVTAAAIYVVRNPLDVVISAADHFGLSLDESIEFMANPDTATQNDSENAGAFLGSWSDHVESWTVNAHPSFVVLKYEDMLDNPLATFARVAKLLGLEKDKARIKKAIRFSSFQELKKQESAVGFVERSPASKSFFRKGQKHQWINELNDDQIASMVHNHRQQMLRFNYVPPKFR